ncbi:MAG: hypothetical protein GXW90_03885 [Tepidanaerobacter acetatoxydans]|uniref:hypothetical protein n=1 Tax=Tepidanaerobacter TaxID=499228 RepID=UPI000A4396AC|nr:MULTISPECIES: hypothetical protein [Tepidanaerobacter]NLU10079.1 hypothetical protein [Tepidanaerobacter acetatoxydans]
MKRLYTLTLIFLFLLTSSVALAAEYGSVYVWYNGKNSNLAPPNQLTSDIFTVGKKETIKSLTVKGYGQYAKRLYIVFYDKYGNKGFHLVDLTNCPQDDNDVYTYEYTPNSKDKEWKSVSLEYNIKNFNTTNRNYNYDSLFWIENVNDYQLEPPSSEDDLTP